MPALAVEVRFYGAMGTGGRRTSICAADTNAYCTFMSLLAAVE